MTFELADLPMLASALSIGRNTAMMYHRERQKLRMEEYRKAFEEAIPYAARVFSPYDFCDIVLAISEGASYEVRAERRTYYSDHDVIATVGDRSYRSKDQYREGHEAVVQAVRELFDELSTTAGE